MILLLIAEWSDGLEDKRRELVEVEMLLQLLKKRRGKKSACYEGSMTIAIEEEALKERSPWTV